MPDLMTTDLAALDPDVWSAVTAELGRQWDTLETRQAQGTVLTNKYAEGYPGRRYYGGCAHVDTIGRLAIERVKALFGAEYANVQPHSGAQANAAAMAALLDPGDTVLGLDLAHGGHLTHGMALNFSGKLYRAAAYHVSTTDYRVDMAEVAALAREHRPKLIIAGWSAYRQQGGPLQHVIAAKAVAFGIAASPEFRERQERTLRGARILAERLAVEHTVLTGGTDVHLVLVDLRESTLDGRAAEHRLDEIGITVNRNAVPFDPRPPMVSSGLRIGTPALATRGFTDADFREVADIIAIALRPEMTSSTRSELGDRVSALVRAHPLYTGLS